MRKKELFFLNNTKNKKSFLFIRIYVFPERKKKYTRLSYQFCNTRNTQFDQQSPVHFVWESRGATVSLTYTGAGHQCSFLIGKYYELHLSDRKHLFRKHCLQCLLFLDPWLIVLTLVGSKWKATCGDSPSTISLTSCYPY